MSAKRNANLLFHGPAVVGTIYSEASLARARTLHAGDVDFLEIRVDHFAADPAALHEVLGTLKFPLILTVRHPAEGGSGALSLARRRDLLLEFLPAAALVDVELRSVAGMGEVIAAARAREVGVIVSDHHFRSTPAVGRLRERLHAARAAGADIFKVAALATRPADLTTLLTFLTEEKRLPLSVMGMGSWGKISRLLCAQGGSVLNYGYLAEPQVSGQWEAVLLKERIRELIGTGK